MHTYVGTNDCSPPSTQRGVKRCQRRGGGCDRNRSWCCYTWLAVRRHLCRPTDGGRNGDETEKNRVKGPKHSLDEARINKLYFFLLLWVPWNWLPSSLPFRVRSELTAFQSASWACPSIHRRRRLTFFSIHLHSLKIQNVIYRTPKNIHSKLKSLFFLSYPISCDWFFSRASRSHHHHP